MLRYLRQGQRWIMLAVIVLVGGVFVLFIGVGAPLVRMEQDVVVQVGDRQYGAREVLRVRAQQEEEFRRALGSSFDPKAAAPQLDSYAANAVAYRAILTAEAERLGMRVSDDELRDAVKGFGAFRDEQGRFSSEAYKNYVQYEYGNERLFVQTLRDDLLASKLARLIGASTQVSQVEAREALRQRIEQIELAIVALDTSRRPDGFQATKEQIQELLAKDEARVRAAYDAQASRFHQPERAHARHILVRVAKDAPPDAVEAARAAAAGARERVAKGEDFAVVAREISDDPGSKEAGGDLGLFPRGQMVPAFDEVAFTLEPGALSEPIRTDFGFHVIRVEERRPPEDRTFEDAREELAGELLAQEAGRAAAREDANDLLEKVRGGESLEAAARSMKLPIERPGPMARRADGFVPGLGLAPDVLNAAFAAPANVTTLPRVFEVGDRLVLVQILERSTPDPDRIAKELPAEVERLTQEKRQRLQSAWIDARRAALASEGRFRVDPTAIDRRPTR